MPDDDRKGYAVPPRARKLPAEFDPDAWETTRRSLDLPAPYRSGGFPESYVKSLGLSCALPCAAGTWAAGRRAGGSAPISLAFGRGAQVARPVPGRLQAASGDRAEPNGASQNGFGQGVSQGGLRILPRG